MAIHFKVVKLSLLEPNSRLLSTSPFYVAVATRDQQVILLGLKLVSLFQNQFEVHQIKKAHNFDNGS